jgi:5'(3')-deoxyribonucleotidase
MKIGIDMDDVLANFQKRFVKLLNELYGKTPLDAEPIDWDWTNCNVTPEEMKNGWIEASKTTNLWLELEPLPALDMEAKFLLSKLDLVHDLFFVTNRFITPGLSPTKQTQLWVRENTYLPMPNVMLAKDKGPMASVLELEAFIDDRPKNCLDVLAARPQCRVFLCDSSHNQTFNGGERIPRVASLKEFAKIILENTNV